MGNSLRPFIQQIYKIETEGTPKVTTTVTLLEMHEPVTRDDDEMFDLIILTGMTNIRIDMLSRLQGLLVRIPPRNF